jgi:NAD(P)-dependent dehydrogenase (short-subunit alcohol dehydrogenase family)
MDGFLPTGLKIFVYFWLKYLFLLFGWKKKKKGEIPDDVWDRVIAVNVTAPMKLTRAVIPIMLKIGKGVVFSFLFDVRWIFLS